MDSGFIDHANELNRPCISELNNVETIDFTMFTCFITLQWSPNCYQLKLIASCAGVQARGQFGQLSGRAAQPLYAVDNRWSPPAAMLTRPPLQGL